MSGLGTARACALCLAVVCASRAARAADANEPAAIGAPAAYPQIHLDVSPPDSSVVPLLRAELGELDLAVVDGATSNGPSITVHATLSDDSLDVRITDDETGNTLVREVFSVTDGRTMEPRTAVLHAVELLRWHLRYRAPTPERLPPPAASVSTLAPLAVDEAGTDLRLSVIPLAIYSPGGTELGLGAELDLLRRWHWFGVRVLGGTALVPNRMSLPEGQLQVRSSWAGLEGALVLEPGTSGTALELGLGAALFTSTLHGAAGGDNSGRDDQLLTLAPLVDLRARQRIRRGFTLVLASACLVPLEASGLRVLGRQVGSYGREVVTLGLGLELTLF